MRSLLTLSIALLFNLFLIFTVDAQQSNAPDPFTGLDTAFTRILKDWHAVGFAVAVVKKDNLLYAQGFGYRDWEKRQSVTSHTLFPIGSCTKAFTASLLGQLEAKKLLDLDHPVRDYLPELKFYNVTMDNMITLRDMLTHRTGLPRYDYAWFLFSGPRDSMLHKIRYMEPTAPVRTRWQYNNFMFLAQGMVAEKLTGKSWEQNVSENIFQPLGMTASNCTIGALQASPEVSLGYGVKNDSLIHRMTYHDVDAAAPAGAINSNVTDLSSWVMTWINNGKFHGKQVLPGDYVNEATSVQMAMGGGLPSKEMPDIYFSGYGFGWFISSYRGHYRVDHGGNIDGFSADICFFPSDSLGIIVLSNQNNSVVPGIVRNLLADRLMNLPYRDWSENLKKQMSALNPAQKDVQAAKIANPSMGNHPLSHPLPDYTGLYSDPLYGSFEIKLQNDSLIAFFPHRTWLLKHWDYDIFQAFDGPPGEGYDTVGGVGLRMQFNMDGLGNIHTLSMDLDPANGKPSIFTRKPVIPSLDAAGLKKYTGQYQLTPEMIVTVVLKDDKTLYLEVPGQPEYELVPESLGKFSIKGLNGFLEQFNTDVQGNVIELLSMQPNGTYKIKKIK